MGIKKNSHRREIPKEPVTMDIVEECKGCKACLTLEEHVRVCRTMRSFKSLGTKIENSPNLLKIQDSK